MKKIFLILFVGFFSSSLCWAGLPGLQVEVAPEVGISGAGTGAYDTGFGGGLFLGLRPDPSLSIGVDLSAYTFALSEGPGVVTASGGISTLELAAKVKLRSSGAPLHVLFTAGAGLGSLSNNGAETVVNPLFGTTASYSTNLTATDPFVEGGLGLEANLKPGAELYLLAQVNYLFDNSGKFWHLPLMAGASFSL